MSEVSKTFSISRSVDQHLTHVTAYPDEVYIDVNEQASEGFFTIDEAEEFAKQILTAAHLAPKLAWGGGDEDTIIRKSSLKKAPELSEVSDGEDG